MSSAQQRIQILFAIATLAFGSIGALWTRDRTTRWETPRLDPARFEAVRALGPRTTGSTRLVAVNLACASCATALRRLEAHAPDEGRIVLIVDHPGRPSASALRAIRSGHVWWDREGIWRRRWGHRVYGEVLRFDRHGRYLGTVPPSG